jgi:nitrile hydratase
MNGVHDMGGMHGFGKVEPEADEPPFHAGWEGRVLAMQRAMAFTGAWNIDMSRAAQERLPAKVYLSVSYYRRWALGMESNALEKGLIDADEIAAGHTLRPGKPVERTMTKDQIGRAFTRGSFSRPTSTTARFQPGDRVRTRNINPPSHTRLPRYARGRVGVVDRDHGVFVFADASGNGLGKIPQHVYAVRFTARELWGDAALPRDTVSIDLWDDHLDPA